jgi:chromosome segregation ATPase
MQVDTVRTAYDELLGFNLEPTVRRVRERIGYGSLTDINRMVGEIREERAIERLASSTLPFGLRDRCESLLLQIWQAADAQASERARQAEAACAARIGALENDVATMLAEGDRAIVETDELKATVKRLTAELSSERDKRTGAEKELAVASQRCRDLTQRADGLQQALNFIGPKAGARKLLPGPQNVPTPDTVQQEVWKWLETNDSFDPSKDFRKLKVFDEKYYSAFEALLEEMKDDGIVFSAGLGKVQLRDQ